MSIFDLVQAQNLTAYWTEAKAGLPPYLGEVLFPNKKQLGLELGYIKGSNGLPVELKLSNFDAKTTYRDRIGFQEVKTKMPFFKEGAYIDEDLRQQLNQAIMVGSQEYVKIILKQIFEVNAGLIDSAKVSRERMRMQLLSTGAVTIASNGMEYSYDYQMPSTHKKTLSGTNKWSDLTNSNPIKDLNDWKQVIEEEQGVEVSKAIMARKTFNYIVNNEKLAKSIYITNNGVGVVTDAMVINAIKVLTGLTVVIYDKMYKNASNVATRYFPEDLVTLIPDGNLGNTYFGTTPEESDLMLSKVANVSIIDTGVAVTTREEADPVNVFTKVSQISLPSFEQIDNIIIATVN